MNTKSYDIDLIDEFRFRRWARQYYVGPQYRKTAWHPIILEEMRRKDAEKAVSPHARCARVQ